MEDSVFNIVETVEEVVSSVAPQACEKGVELIAVVDPQIPRFLRGDSRRLRQILLNFLRYILFFFTVHRLILFATALLSSPPPPPSTNVDIIVMQ
jgi:nitrogen-specific signal transduction histidine kinase